MKTIIDVDQTLKDLSLEHLSDDISYQQIMDKIGRLERERAPKVMILSILSGIIFIVCLNVSYWSKTEKSNDENLLEEAQLVSNNSIYGEA